MTKVKKIIKIFFGLPLTILAFFFIGKIVYDSLPQISSHIIKANIILVFLGIFFMLLFFLVRSIAWAKLLNFFGESEKGLFNAVYSYSAAETKRYIPGNIFSFVSRIQKFENPQLPKNVLIKALVLESIVMVLSACVISLPAMLGLIDKNNYFPIAIVAGAIVIVGLTVQKYKEFVLSFFS